MRATVSFVHVDDESVLGDLFERRPDILELFGHVGPEVVIGRASALGGATKVSPTMWLPGYVILGSDAVIALKTNVLTDTESDRPPSLVFRPSDVSDARLEVGRRGDRVVVTLSSGEKKLFEVSAGIPSSQDELEREAALALLETTFRDWALDNDIDTAHLGTLPTLGESVAARTRETLATTSDKLTLAEFREVMADSIGKIVEVLAVHEAEISRLQQENRRLSDELERRVASDPLR